MVAHCYPVSVVVLGSTEVEMTRLTASKVGAAVKDPEVTRVPIQLLPDVP
jgi:hypothetical protein